MALQCYEEIIFVKSLHSLSGKHRRRGGGDERVEVSVEWDEKFGRT